MSMSIFATSFMSIIVIWPFILSLRYAALWSRVITRKPRCASVAAHPHRWIKLEDYNSKYLYILWINLILKDQSKFVELFIPQIIAFMESGSMTVCDFVLTTVRTPLSDLFFFSSILINTILFCSLSPLFLSEEFEIYNHALKHRFDSSHLTLRILVF